MFLREAEETVNFSMVNDIEYDTASGKVFFKQHIVEIFAELIEKFFIKASAVFSGDQYTNHIESF